MSCLLCDSKENIHYNLQNDESLYSQKKLIDLIDFLLDEFICPHYNVCKSCYNVLNELDSLKMKCDIIFYKFRSHLLKPFKEEAGDVQVKTEVEELDQEAVSETDNNALETSSNERIFGKSKSLQKSSKSKTVVKEKTVCEICGKDVQNIKLHKQIHNPVRLKCDKCDVTFSLRSSLWRHRRIHTGEKYQCELCGKQFTHKTSFSAHMMSHSGVKKIDCHLCDMKFYTKGHLNRHLRLHYDEKPYECSFCQRRFRERYNMKLHERTMHKKDKEPT